MEAESFCCDLNGKKTDGGGCKYWTEYVTNSNEKFLSKDKKLNSSPHKESGGKLKNPSFQNNNGYRQKRIQAFGSFSLFLGWFKLIATTVVFIITFDMIPSIPSNVVSSSQYVPTDHIDLMVNLLLGIILIFLGSHIKRTTGGEKKYIWSGFIISGIFGILAVSLGKPSLMLFLFLSSIHTLWVCRTPRKRVESKDTIQDSTQSINSHKKEAVLNSKKTRWWKKASVRNNFTKEIKLLLSLLVVGGIMVFLASGLELDIVKSQRGRLYQTDADKEMALFFAPYLLLLSYRVIRRSLQVVNNKI
jgi:hypothetical protein